jgi:hypothetical protein
MPLVPYHDVGCTQVVSPPEGYITTGNYDVIGQIHNFGTVPETFDVRAVVYDTANWWILFDQVATLTDFPAGADTTIDFGVYNFGPWQCFYTEIYTALVDDENHTNDTSSIHSRTAHIIGDIIFEMDIGAICNDNQLLGIQYDGQRFYITGGNNGVDPNKIYVVDTNGTLLLTLDQPAHCTGWGWHDLAWDWVYTGPDRIDTLYASVNSQVDCFSISFNTNSLIYHGDFPGAQSPNRALAYSFDSMWFYTANFTSDCWRFGKSGGFMHVPNTYSMYGAAYDHNPNVGGADQYVWWHSWDDPGTGFLCQISKMDPSTMSFIDQPFGYTLPAALTDARAGGLCYYDYYGGGWPGIEVLFALLQGTPHDYIVGIYLRGWIGIEDKPDASEPLMFGFAPTSATIAKGTVPIAYSTNRPGKLTLKVYNTAGRLVCTLIDGYEQAGRRMVYWDGKDDCQRNVPSGVYLLHLEADNKIDIHKLVLIK